MNLKFIAIQQSKTKPQCYCVEILSHNRVVARNKLYPASIVSAARQYTVNQKRLEKILSIVGHENFDFGCFLGKITLYGEYNGRNNG